MDNWVQWLASEDTGQKKGQLRRRVQAEVGVRVLVVLEQEEDPRCWAEGEKEGERWERKDRKLREAEKQKDGGGQGLKGEPKLRQAPELCSSAMPTPPNTYPSQTAGKGPGRPEWRSGGVRQGDGGCPPHCSPASGCPVPSSHSTWGSYRACSALGRRGMVCVGGGGLRC